MCGDPNVYWFEPRKFIQWAQEKGIDVPPGLASACDRKVQPPKSAPQGCTIRKGHKTYVIQFRGESSPERDGYYYIGYLIQRKNHPVDPQEMYSALKKPGESSIVKGPQTRQDEDSDEGADSDDGGQGLSKKLRTMVDDIRDQQTREEYDRALRELDRRIEIAEETSNAELDALRKAKTELLKELATSHGAKNLFRNARKQARDRVKKAVDLAIEALPERLAIIRQHLNKCLKLKQGHELTYHPDGSIEWDVDLS